MRFQQRGERLIQIIMGCINGCVLGGMSQEDFLSEAGSREGLIIFRTEYLSTSGGEP